MPRSGAAISRCNDSRVAALSPISPISPDGRFVAAALASGVISVLSLDGAEPTTLPGTGPNDLPIQWTPDGTHLLVYDVSEIPAKVAEIELASGKRKPWRAFTPIDRAGVFGISKIVITSDRKAYVYSYDQFRSNLYLVKGLR